MNDNCNTHDLAEGTARHWLTTCHPQPGDRLYFVFTPQHLAELGILVHGPVTVEMVYHGPGTVISGESLAGVLEYSRPVVG